MRWYIKNLLIAVDQLLNALIGGWCDESLSSHAYRMDVEQGKGWVKKVIDTLLFFDEDHCHQSYLSEIERRHLPPNMRCNNNENTS